MYIIDGDIEIVNLKEWSLSKVTGESYGQKRFLQICLINGMNTTLINEELRQQLHLEKQTNIGQHWMRKHDSFPDFLVPNEQYWYCSEIQLIYQQCKYSIDQPVLIPNMPYPLIVGLSGLSDFQVQLDMERRILTPLTYMTGTFILGETSTSPSSSIQQSLIEKYL
ncbi:unnamed protein product [Didymodactylos carnosus]|uniref:Uncharacterized protein n=1 Tax=Didymodactylos carnosus TaxID=1234261 RepID=A0A8S2S693_9BILA|nr:unnamed protein product [Didymodactylos carnosus]CAF4200647.1 unnamed protein product [Didymodactylos carnosus]